MFYLLFSHLHGTCELTKFIFTQETTTNSYQGHSFFFTPHGNKNKQITRITMRKDQACLPIYYYFQVGASRVCISLLSLDRCCTYSRTHITQLPRLSKMPATLSLTSWHSICSSMAISGDITMVRTVRALLRVTLCGRRRGLGMCTRSPPVRVIGTLSLSTYDM